MQQKGAREAPLFCRPDTGLQRREQGELGYRRSDALALFVDENIVAAHCASRRIERTARNIVIALARGDHRHLADYALTTHFVEIAAPVDDPPIAFQQLDRLLPAI